MNANMKEIAEGIKDIHFGHHSKKETQLLSYVVVCLARVAKAEDREFSYDEFVTLCGLS